jgi:hypothetical protein
VIANKLHELGPLCRLKSLDFNWNLASESGFLALVGALYAVPLEEVIWDMNLVDDAGTEALVVFLRSPQCNLKVLSL